MGEYESGSARRQNGGAGPSRPVDVKPVLVLTSDGEQQARVFYEDVPIGGRLRMSRRQPDRKADNFAVGELCLEEVEPEGNRKRATEPGGPPPSEGLVDSAHQRGYWIRFYTSRHPPRTSLKGWTPSYNFGSLEAVTLRWRPPGTRV